MHESVRRGRRGAIAPVAVLAIALLCAGRAAAKPTRIFLFGVKAKASYDVKKSGPLLGEGFTTPLGTLSWGTDAVSGTRFDVLMGTITTPVEGTPPTLSAELDQNYPNPFNPRTRIPFTLAQSGHVLIRIFDVRGAHVATVHDGSLNEGRHSLEWTGRDDHGQPVASGMYLYTLTTNGQTLSRKMVVLK